MTLQNSHNDPHIARKEALDHSTHVLKKQLLVCPSHIPDVSDCRSEIRPSPTIKKTDEGTIKRLPPATSINLGRSRVGMGTSYHCWHERYERFFSFFGSIRGTEEVFGLFRASQMTRRLLEGFIVECFRVFWKLSWKTFSFLLFFGVIGVTLYGGIG